MRNPIDYDENRLFRVFSAVMWIVGGVAVVVVGGAVYEADYLRAFGSDLGENIETVSNVETSRDVARYFADWGLFEALRDDDPEYAKVVASTSAQITGVNGLIEYDWHGSGTMWYEVTLSPGLADQLRSALKTSATIAKSNYIPEESTPADGWPKTWPADARCYMNNGSYSVLPDSGTHAWFMYMGT